MFTTAPLGPGSTAFGLKKQRPGLSVFFENHIDKPSLGASPRTLNTTFDRAAPEPSTTNDDEPLLVLATEQASDAENPSVESELAPLSPHSPK
jgi:hypothetical protein